MAAPGVTGLHLQNGADASTEVVVSWHTTTAVRNPRVILGTPDDGFGRIAATETVAFQDAASQSEVRVHHARFADLNPDTDYVYAAFHDGAGPEYGTVRTAPRGRKPLQFTSFGDRSTPTLDALVASTFGRESRDAPAAGDITTAVECVKPPVQPRQRRPVLCQRGARPGRDVGELVREQFTIRATSTVDACCRQP